MTTQATIRTLALSLLLVSGASHAGLFSKKAKAPPPPPEPAPVVVPVAPPPPPPPIPLEFSGIQTEAPLPTSLDRLQSASAEVLDVVQWVGASKDNAGLPFIVVDKANARVYAFNPAAQLKATAPVLLGMGVGDKPLVSPNAPMSAIPPQKRITPAGRYPSKLVLDNHGKVVLLIDGENLITMHIVVKGTPAQRRAERLASVATDDNRVSYGCINVPPAFFTTVVDPDFRPAKGIVYVLPEKTTAAQLFGFQPAVTAPPALQAPVGLAAQAPVASAAAQAPVASAESQAPVVSVALQAPVVSAESQAPVASAEPQVPVASAEPQVPVVSAEPQVSLLAPEPSSTSVQGTAAGLAPVAE